MNNYTTLCDTLSVTPAARVISDAARSSAGDADKTQVFDSRLVTMTPKVYDRFHDAEGLAAVARSLRAAATDGALTQTHVGAHNVSALFLQGEAIIQVCVVSCRVRTTAAGKI